MKLGDAARSATMGDAIRLEVIGGFLARPEGLEPPTL
jgi:hypothetical protein